MTFGYDVLNHLTSRTIAGVLGDMFSYATSARRAVALRTVGSTGVSRDSTYLNSAFTPDSIVRRLGGKRFVLHYTYDTLTIGRQTGFNVTSDAGTHLTTRSMVIDTVTGVLDTLTIGSGT